MEGGYEILLQKSTYLRRTRIRFASPREELLHAITAYNTGEGCVEEAARRTGLQRATLEETIKQLTPALMKKCVPKADPLQQSRDARNFAKSVMSKYQTFLKHYLTRNA